MERCGKERPRRGREYPSFSSTLLDVIYRSIDESEGGGEADQYSSAVAPRRPIPPAKERTLNLIRPRVLQPISTSSSSDNSSYGGFSSSSEPDSAASRRSRIRPIRTLPPPSRSTTAVSARPPPPPPPPPPLPSRLTQRAPSPPAKQHRERTRSSSIRSKLRDLGRPKMPASPGSRLASLLNSLFANGAGKQRKPKPSPPTVDDSPCSAASTRSRPCLVKTPSSRRGPTSDDEGFKRSVRFHPVSVVMGEEILPCGQKSAYAGDPAAAARLDDRRRPATVADGKAREDARRKVEDMLRSLEVEEEDEDEMSDSSSDLFELDNLTVRGAGGGALYRDELPVYETTHPGNNRAFLAASSNKNY